MNPKKAVKELDKQLRKDPNNLVLRVRLAGAHFKAGNIGQAIELYRSVALSYLQQGRLDQAIAVCHSLLEIAPDHADTRALLADLDAHKAAQSQQMAAAAAAQAALGADQVLKRRLARPSGFETDAFTPGSEPELLSGSRVRRVEPSRPPDPATGSITGPTGRTPASPTPTPQTPTSPIAHRLPLRRDSLLDTPVAGEVRRRPGESGPQPRPGGRPSEPPPLTGHVQLGARPTGGPDPEEEAPTRVADRWAMPVRARPTTLRRDSWLGQTSSTGGAGRVRLRSDSSGGDLSTGARTPSRLREGSTVTRADPVRSRVPHDLASGRSRPPGGSPGDSIDDFLSDPRGSGVPGARKTLRGAGPVPAPPPAPTPLVRVPRPSGDDGEATLMDDGLELARALGRVPGGEEDAAPDPLGPLSALSSLGRQAVDAIAAGTVRRKVGAGEMFLREGEPGESCFVLAQGEARVLKRDPLHPRGDLVEVGRLHDGDLFGEVAMLSDQRRHATVQAVSDCELLEIPRQHLRRVAARFPEVDGALERFYRERLISTLVSTAAFFRPLEPADRAALISHFQFERVEAGARVIAEGERSGGFYLLVLGAVEITKRVSDKRQVLLATLGEGSYFGEMSLLRGDVARASVTATGPAELAVLPAKNFYALVANHPILWDQVRQEAHRRELEMVQIVTGVSGSV